MRYGVTRQVVPIMPPRHPRALALGTCARAPYRLRAAFQRCGALLWGSCALARLLRLGAAVRGVGRRAALLWRAVGVCARALAACALLRRACALVGGSKGGWAQLARGSMRSGKALRSVTMN